MSQSRLYKCNERLWNGGFWREAVIRSHAAADDLPATRKTREHWLALEISTLNNLVMDEIGKNCGNFHRGESPWRKKREIFAQTTPRATIINCPVLTSILSGGDGSLGWQ
jgi:hypothetical protein